MKLARLVLAAAATTANVILSGYSIYMIFLVAIGVARVPAIVISAGILFVYGSAACHAISPTHFRTWQVAWVLNTAALPLIYAGVFLLKDDFATPRSSWALPIAGIAAALNVVFLTIYRAQKPSVH